MERKSIYIVIFVITTIIASCVAVYFAGVRNNEINELKQTVNNLTLQLENNKEIQAEKMEINISKNVDNIQNIEAYVIKDDGNVAAKVQNGKAYVKVINSGKISSNVMWKKNLNEFYEIENINGVVVDICTYRYVGSGEYIFILLMEDGTLQKTKISDGSSFICEGKIDGYENIIRIDDVEVKNENQFGDEISVFYSKAVVATDSNGNTELLKGLY